MGLEMDVVAIYSIIVVFNANRKLLENTVSSLKSQGSKVVLVINDDQKYGEIEADKIIYAGENLGIAGAQNKGIELAIKEKAKYVAIFDQDSVVPNNYVSSMLEGLKRADKVFGNVGMIGPRIYDTNMNMFVEPRVYSFKGGDKIVMSMPREELKQEINNKFIRLAAKPIASGAFIPTTTFKRVGMMDDKLFIDLVDTDFDIRILQDGLNIVQANKVTLHHEIGSRKQVKIGKYTIWPTNHSSKRRYTIVRNTIWLWKKYHSSVQGMTRETLRTLISTFIYIQFEKESFSKSKAYFKGLVDGVKGNGK
ncbi:glycosyltransferase [Limosilactobacillus fermentum]|nr:glycosyltransferase [Limosilactobacillus fermentum]